MVVASIFTDMLCSDIPKVAVVSYISNQPQHDIGTSLGWEWYGNLMGDYPPTNYPPARGFDIPPCSQNPESQGEDELLPYGQAGLA